MKQTLSKLKLSSALLPHPCNAGTNFWTGVASVQVMHRLDQTWPGAPHLAEIRNRSNFVQFQSDGKQHSSLYVPAVFNCSCTDRNINKSCPKRKKSMFDMVQKRVNHCEEWSHNMEVMLWTGLVKYLAGINRYICQRAATKKKNVYTKFFKVPAKKSFD